MKQGKTLLKNATLFTLLCAASINLLACQNQQTAQNSPAQSSEAAQPGKQDEKTHLLIHCGAGVKKAMDEIAHEFEQQHPGVIIDRNYAGSGKLLAQLQSSSQGDIFLVGMKADFETAQKEGLVHTQTAVAHHTPAIVVQKGNPKQIQTLSDLTKPGIELVLGDPQSASIGKTAYKIFEKNKIEGIEKNLRASVGTVNEIVTAIQAKNADAGICTKDSVFDAEGIELITIPADQNIDQILTAGIVSTSEHPDLAEEFLNYLLSDKGIAAFEHNGFLPISKAH